MVNAKYELDYERPLSARRTELIAFKDLPIGASALVNIHNLIYAPASVLAQVWVSYTTWSITSLINGHQARVPHFAQCILLQRGSIWAEIANLELFETLFRAAEIRKLEQGRALVLITHAYPIINFPFTLGGKYAKN